MIVKTTFRDNDYTSLLEKYWNKFLFCNSRCAINKLEGREYVDASIELDDLLQKVIYQEDRLTVKELKRFTEIIKDSIIEFLKIKKLDESTIKYLTKQLEVHIEFKIEDKDLNGEVVYYMFHAQKVITL